MAMNPAGLGEDDDEDEGEGVAAADPAARPGGGLLVLSLGGGDLF